VRIVLDIGGSLIVSPSPKAEYLRRLSDLLIRLDEEGHQIMVVVGGGRVAREYVATGRELGADETYLDEIGIAATRLNAMLLIAALGKHASKEIETSTLGAGKGKKIRVMGGTKPGQTTDAVAAQLAWRSHADLLIVATDVDGIYEKDPKENPGARKFSALTFEDLSRLEGRGPYRAGSSAILDPVAVRTIRKNRIRTIVLDGRDPGRIEAAVRGGDHGGTVIGEA
jgi:uridylate kinase